MPPATKPSDLAVRWSDEEEQMVVGMEEQMVVGRQELQPLLQLGDTRGACS